MQTTDTRAALWQRFADHYAQQAALTDDPKKKAEWEARARNAKETAATSNLR